MKNKAISSNYQIELLISLLSHFRKLQLPSPFPAETEPASTYTEVSEKLSFSQSFSKKPNKNTKNKLFNKRKSEHLYNDSTESLASQHFVRLYQGNANA